MLDVQVASRFVERLKTEGLRKLENIKKISNLGEVRAWCPVSRPKIKIWQ